MATGATVGYSSTSPRPGQGSDRTAQLRVWPAAVLLAAFWVFLYANHHADLSMTARFFSRMIAYALLLLLFLGWWLSRSTVRWRDRLLAVAVVVLLLANADFLADKTMNAFAIVLLSMPYVFIVWTAWLFVSRRMTIETKRLGFCIAMAITTVPFTLLPGTALTPLKKRS